MKARRPKKGTVSKRLDRAASVHRQIEVEKARHARKTATLLEQTAVAGRTSDPDRRDLALTRLRGEGAEEDARHRDKLDAFNERLRRIWA